LVKITFKPWEELMIHESIHYSLEDLVKLCSIGVQPGALGPPLRWAEGVVFLTQPMPPTNEVVKESLDGRIHWNSVSWALMPAYKNIIPISEINAKIPVIDVSRTAILCEVAKALAEQVSK
jgi:hypothetical protein